MKKELLKVINNQIEECLGQINFLQKTTKIFFDFSEFFKTHNLQLPASKIDDVYNLHILFVITELEINFVLRELYYAKSEMEKKYVIKRGFLNIYEFFKTFNTFSKDLILLTSKDLRLKNDFEKITKDLRVFKNNIKLTSKVKNIRNKTAGHLHQNIEDYFDILNKIDIQQDENHLIDFVIIISELNDMIFNYSTENFIREQGTENIRQLRKKIYK